MMKIYAIGSFISPSFPPSSVRTSSSWRRSWTPSMMPSPCSSGTSLPPSLPPSLTPLSWHVDHGSILHKLICWLKLPLDELVKRHSCTHTHFPSLPPFLPPYLSQRARGPPLPP